MKTDQVCPECAETIVFTEEVVLIEIVQLRVDQGMLIPMMIPDQDGDFLFAPYHMHFSPCWESIEEWLEEELEDALPVDDPMGHPTLGTHCRYCQSWIREWEFCGTVTMGEIHVSPRRPAGVREETWAGAGEPAWICLYCLFLINEGNIELWDPEEGGVYDGHVDPGGQCGDCLQARCWRAPPDVMCDCPCHSQEGTDDDNRDGNG